MLFKSQKRQQWVFIARRAGWRVFVPVYSCGAVPIPVRLLRMPCFNVDLAPDGIGHAFCEISEDTSNSAASPTRRSTPTVRRSLRQSARLSVTLSARVVAH